MANVNEIVIENINELCRICASKIDILEGINIFEAKNNVKRVYNRIIACLPIQVVETDEFPKLICTECYYKLDLCFTFRNKSLETERFLKNHINTKKKSEINKIRSEEDEWEIVIGEHISNDINTIEHSYSNINQSGMILNNDTEQRNENESQYYTAIDFNEMTDTVASGEQVEKEEFALLTPKTEVVEVDDLIKFYCDLCNRVLNSEDEYINHYEMHLNKCISCEMYFPNENDLQTHRNEMHSNQNMQSIKIESNENCDENDGTMESCSAQSTVMEIDSEDSPNEFEAATNPSFGIFIPEKSSRIYERSYKDFKDWCDNKNVQEISENVMMSYFDEKSKKVKSPTLWSLYSMLKTMLHIKEKVDVLKFVQLLPFLKKTSIGYQAKSTMIFTQEQINKFIREAPDGTHLLRKLVLIIGVCGACRGIDLINMTVDDVEDNGSVLIIKVPNSQTNMHRIFIINNLRHVELYRKYIALRPLRATTRRLFLRYIMGSCTNQVIGIHKIGAIPREIAKYLALPNPESYTAHCLKRTSATLKKCRVRFAPFDCKRAENVL